MNETTSEPKEFFEYTIRFQCPHCHTQDAETFAISIKDLNGVIPRNEPHAETACLPYTKEYGTPEDKWTRIGGPNDKINRLLNWQSFGITRIEDNSVLIWYKSPECKECRAHYDAYLNLTQGRDLEDLWPHLLGGSGIYKGRTFALQMVECIGQWFTETYIGALLVGLGLLLLSFVPFFFFDRTKVDAWSLTSTMILRSAGAACLIAILTITSQYAKLLESSETRIRRLFHNCNDRQVRYWINFTWSRIAGVQRFEARRDEEKKLCRVRSALPQSAIVAGLPSAILVQVLLVWTPISNLLSKLPPRPKLVALALIPLSYLAGLLPGLLVQHVAASSSKRDLAPWIVGAAPLQFYLLSLSAMSLSLYSSREYAITYITDIVFWTIVTFHIGCGAWLAMNISTYVLQGSTQIRMNLSPLDHFAGDDILFEIARLSTRMMVSIFMFSVFVVAYDNLFSISDSLIPMTRTSKQLVLWVEGAMVVAFLGLSLGFFLESRAWIFFTMLYFAGLVLTLLGPTITTDPVVPFLAPFPIPAFRILNLLLVGVFLSYLLYLDYQMCRRAINKIRQDHKDRCLAEYTERHAKWEKRQEALESELVQTQDMTERRLYQKLQSLKIMTEHTDQLFGICTRIKEEPIGSRYSEGREQRKVLAPAVSAILLVVLEVILTLALSSIFPKIPIVKP